MPSISNVGRGLAPAECHASKQGSCTNPSPHLRLQVLWLQQAQPALCRYSVLPEDSAHRLAFRIQRIQFPFLGIVFNIFRNLQIVFPATDHMLIKRGLKQPVNRPHLLTLPGCKGFIRTNDIHNRRAGGVLPPFLPATGSHEYGSA